MTSNEEIITEQPKSSGIDVCQSSVVIELESKTTVKGENKLELIKDYEALIVKQELDFVGSAYCSSNCCDKLNKYSIKNCNGKTILTAVEEENCCNISCCRTGRRFNMKLLDEFGSEIIHLRIPIQCNCFRCFCCCCSHKQDLEVYSPPDHLIGRVRETWNCFHKQLNVYRTSKLDPVYNIDGPVCGISNCCRRDIKFTIENYETAEECGIISKKWNGLSEEIFTDNFSVNLPKTADMEEKALLLSACIMIDLMYFESKSDEEKKKEMLKEKEEEKE